MPKTVNFPLKRMYQAILLSPLLATFPSGAAVAQTASPTLEEVVVTAQRKTESLQEAPIAITALGANELESQGISDLTDLRGTTPSLSVAPFAGDRATPVVFVRGMGTIVVQTTQDTAVGLYVDGVALGRATGLAADIADIERIEVLRGPQGTLYGKNATAGAINYITKKPGEKFAFEQALTFGNYNKYVSKTSVDLPINDQMLTK
jgi:iron complex outermembrane receptor protein